MIAHGAQSLWAEVLLRAVEDALEGVRGPNAERDKRIKKIIAAREYLTVPNEDCDTVCGLAGIDADTFRNRMQIKIADAPTPDELVENKVRKRKGRQLTLHGETMTVTQWAENLGVASSLIANRLKNGWSVERALTPARTKQPAQIMQVGGYA